jgi:hypothetical protein
MEHGADQHQAKPVLRDIFVVLKVMGDRLKDLGTRRSGCFAGGLRRSELIAVNCNDIERVSRG